MKSLSSNPSSIAREKHPSQPAEIEQPDSQEQKWESQPQTAALPGWSSAAQPLRKWFVSTAHDAPFQSPQFDAAEERERQADRSQREPVSERDHDSRPC